MLASCLFIAKQFTRTAICCILSPTPSLSPPTPLARSWTLLWICPTSERYLWSIYSKSSCLDAFFLFTQRMFFPHCFLFLPLSPLFIIKRLSSSHSRSRLGKYKQQTLTISIDTFLFPFCFVLFIFGLHSQTCDPQMFGKTALVSVTIRELSGRMRFAVRCKGDCVGEEI